MTLSRFMILGAVLFAASPAMAHDYKGPNNGRVVEAGRYHIELLIQGARVDVFLTDANDKPLPADGFKGTAILTAGGKVQRIALEVRQAKLTGAAQDPLPADAKGAVQLTAPDGKTAQAQFK